MKYLHTMVRVRDLDASLRFFRDGLGLLETRRMENDAGQATRWCSSARRTKPRVPRSS